MNGPGEHGTASGAGGGGGGGGAAGAAGRRRRRRSSRFAEVVRHATQDRVRTEAAVERVVRDVDQLDVLGVEEAILQRRVDVVGQRSTDARQSLPREHGVRVVQEVGTTGQGVVRLDARNADTAADEALDAVIGTEVQQAVQHEAERRGGATGIVVVTSRNGARTDAGVGQRGRAERVDGRTTIADFGFQTETTEVVTHHAVNVITIVMVDGGGAGARAGDIVIDIFDDHPAAFDADVPRLVAGEGRRSQSGGGECQNNGKLPHHSPLSWLSLRTAQTHYRSVGFHASKQKPRLWH